MGCGCESKSLFSGGRRKRKRKGSVNSRRGSRRETRRREKRREKRRTRGRKMKGGVSLLGDLQTGLMDVTNKLTGSVLVSPEHYLQPAANNYGSGNSYLV